MVSTGRDPSRAAVARFSPRSRRGGRRFKSCHSDHLSHRPTGVRGMIWRRNPSAARGAASHMKDITRRDLVRRYGYFLDHVERMEGVKRNAKAASYVTPDRVDRFLAELQARVGSVTVYGSIYKLRRM